jgi:hypothetical protein
MSIKLINTKKYLGSIKGRNLLSTVYEKLDFSYEVMHHEITCPVLKLTLLKKLLHF